MSVNKGFLLHRESLTNITGIAGDFSEVRPNENDPQQLEERKYQTGNHEYLYDELGNVIKDKNKGIKSITYNHLNLVERIEYENHKVIEYHYDATGIKLRKTISDENGASVGITHYVGTFVYEGDGASFDLDFMHTSQGRLLFPQSINAHVSTAEYEYHYTDHLGNLRVAFRDGRQYAYTATMETEGATTEESEFANIFITRDGTAAQAGTQSAKVNSGANPLGPWKSIPVQAGDTISATVYSHYKAAPSNNTFNWGIFLGNAPTYGDYTDPSSGENIISPFNAQNLLINVGAVIPAGNTDSNGDEVPNAYLRLLFYDKDNQLRDEKVVQMSALSKNTWLEQLDMGNYVASEAGRIEVFVANESDTDVWFDNLTIVHKEALIVQENAYYPFGLEMAGLQKDNLNKFTFNAQSEKQKDLMGNGYFYETPFRGYDPQLGRFHAVDKLTDYYSGISPYQFAMNSPIRLNDPTGLEPEDDNSGGRGGAGATQGGESYNNFDPSVAPSSSGNANDGGDSSQPTSDGEGGKNKSGGSNDNSAQADNGLDPHTRSLLENLQQQASNRNNGKRRTVTWGHGLVKNHDGCAYCKSNWHTTSRHKSYIDARQALENIGISFYYMGSNLYNLFSNSSADAGNPRGTDDFGEGSPKKYHIDGTIVMDLLNHAGYPFNYHPEKNDYLVSIDDAKGVPTGLYIYKSDLKHIDERGLNVEVYEFIGRTAGTDYIYERHKIGYLDKTTKGFRILHNEDEDFDKLYDSNRHTINGGKLRKIEKKKK